MPLVQVYTNLHIYTTRSYYCNATHPTIPLTHRTYILLCLDERTACMSIYSSDVCAFS